MRRMGKRETAGLAAALWMVMSGWVCAADSTGTPAGGEEEEAYSLAQVTVEAKRPDWESKLSPGTVTVIRPDDYKGEQKTLPELLKQVPGVHVRDVNGKGQYTTVSVRGSTAAQVGVFIDGVLCNLGGDAAVDISTIPVDNVERIEVYRGYIPARFGGTFIGGVINIVTKKPTKAKGTASIGKSSFGGNKGNIEVDAPLGRGSLMFGFNLDESDGDFKYQNRYNADALSAAQKTFTTVKSTELLNINSWIEMLTGGTTYDLTTVSMMDIVNNPNKISDLRTSLYNVASGLGWSDADFNDIFDTFIKGGGSSDSGFTDLWNVLKKIDRYSSANRWRKSNNYKNTDVILKWQDDHWFTKATWKEINRHYPEPIDGNYGSPTDIDLVDDPYYNHRRQKLTDMEILGGRRDTVGNLEWGWSIDYLNQQKRYEIDNWQYLEQIDKVVLQPRSPLFLWSQYDSDRWGAKVDGTYKAGKKHLLEFLLDGSKEELHCKGWRMDTNDFMSSDTRSRWRNYYEQKIFNAQVQDTITLNQKADLWLTPSVRYNQSTIYGLSKYYNKAADPTGIKWLNQADEQTDGKATWQLALKKKVNDELTLRATGGTYYRLLNMYEIAGDGAGILPMPNIHSNGTQSVFPQPEEGTQWDLSAIWDKPVLGARSSRLQLTYFHRDSKKMLQLGDWNRFFFVYTNAASAKIDGLELQWNASWKKWDLDMEGTYMKVKDVKYDMSALPGASYWQNDGRFSGYLTYTPEWEGTVRLAYRPDVRWAIFGQLHYTGTMYTAQLGGGDLSQESALTQLDLGVKYQPTKDWQLTVGVNDLFNKQQDLYQTHVSYANSMLRYPQQGRTYYATLQYNF